jgi:ArsR family transcriptional regulator
VVLPTSEASHFSENVKMRKSSTKFDMELFFKALADRTRLRLLSLISRDEICVCFFVVVFGTNQPKISRHLAYLRRAGLVKARREGKWMHYSISHPSDPNAARIFAEVLAWLKNDLQMQRDRQRLERVCCGNQPPVSIQGAPRPTRLAKIA